GHGDRAAGDFTLRRGRGARLAPGQPAPRTGLAPLLDHGPARITRSSRLQPGRTGRLSLAPGEIYSALVAWGPVSPRNRSRIARPVSTLPRPGRPCSHRDQLASAYAAVSSRWEYPAQVARPGQTDPLPAAHPGTVSDAAPHSRGAVKAKLF